MAFSFRFSAAGGNFILQTAPADDVGAAATRGCLLHNLGAGQTCAVSGVVFALATVHVSACEGGNEVPRLKDEVPDALLM